MTDPTFSVGVLVVVILTTSLFSCIFSLAFRRKQPYEFSNSPGTPNDNILEALAEGSDSEIKKAIKDPKIRVSVLQLQHLGLTRQERRTRNKKFVLCLADSQAESFIELKKRITKEKLR